MVHEWFIHALPLKALTAQQALFHGMFSHGERMQQHPYSTCCPDTRLIYFLALRRSGSAPMISTVPDPTCLHAASLGSPKSVACCCQPARKPAPSLRLHTSDPRTNPLKHASHFIPPRHSCAHAAPALLRTPVQSCAWFCRRDPG